MTSVPRELAARSVWTLVEDPNRARHNLVAEALSAEEHRAFVGRLDDPDLATT